MFDSLGSVQSEFAKEQGVRANPSGFVYLVGAGPGDPGLLTLRGRECLQAAETILYDGLANELLLDFAPQAKCICVGKHGRQRIWTQAEINSTLVDLAQRGQCVVRLKGGDTAVFARTAEELSVLAAHGIPFEVVPGITAGLAAASYVGIPLTHRDHASAVAFITGQQQRDGSQQIDWQALACFPGTLVFYMGVTTVEQWTGQLLAAGKPPHTPCAIVRRCSWPDQQVVRCTLGSTVEHLKPASKMRPPVIVIVGEVAALGSEFDWYSRQPLQGCGILLARTEEQSQDLAEALRRLGAFVLNQPVLEVSPPAAIGPLHAVIHRIAGGQFSGVTFSSSNSIASLFSALKGLGYDSRVFSGLRLAAVGPSTALRLAEHGLRCDVVPDSNFSAAGLAETLTGSVKGEHWLVTTTNRSQSVLPDGLVAAGATVETVQTYATAAANELKPAIESALESHQLHLVAVTSGAIAEDVVRLLGVHTRSLKFVSFSEPISTKLTQLGCPPIAEAEEHSLEALVSTIVQYWQTSRT
ncbi:MAG: uroporphyrinogen-III C-methyltransferase [Planctomycetales bacterium]|nr:uroporphyrinogen-III C-methyltransferase [Planctomycetales bacterium]